MLSGSPIMTTFSAGAFGEITFDAHSQPHIMSQKFNWQHPTPNYVP